MDSKSGQAKENRDRKSTETASLPPPVPFLREVEEQDRGEMLSLDSPYSFFQAMWRRGKGNTP